MRKLSGLMLSLASCLTVSTALANPLPVVAVNREVGLSMAGIFDNLVGGYGSQSQTTGSQWYRPYNSSSQSRSRRIGWVPGFQVDASGMIDLGRATINTRIATPPPTVRTPGGWAAEMMRVRPIHAARSAKGFFS